VNSSNRADKSSVDFDFSCQQVLRVGFALRVKQQRKRTATAKALVQQKINRTKIRQLGALNAALADTVKATLNKVRRDRLNHPAIDFVRTRNQANVARIAFVAGPCQTKIHQAHANRVTCGGKRRFHIRRHKLMRRSYRCVAADGHGLIPNNDGNGDAIARNQGRPVTHNFAWTWTTLVGDIGYARNTRQHLGHQLRGEIAAELAAIRVTSGNLQ